MTRRVTRQRAASARPGAPLDRVCSPPARLPSRPAPRADNIAYGRPGATEAEIIAAAKAAQIWPFICSLDSGLDSKVGERGLKLSGGEKQRVAIARTLLKDPPILVLDEATSALDSITEAEVQEAISRAKQGRTVLVIAHRLSTVRDADEILVLEGGRVVERGAHDALIEKKGRYFALWSQQAQLSSGASGGAAEPTNAAADAPVAAAAGEGAVAEAPAAAKAPAEVAPAAPAAVSSSSAAPR